MPYLLAMLMTEDYEATVCTHPKNTWGVGPTGFWVMLFIYSKVIDASLE
jgi:hypothetical protein